MFTHICTPDRGTYRWAFTLWLNPGATDP